MENILLTRNGQPLLIEKNGVIIGKHGQYWYENTCWKCGVSGREIPVPIRTRYPNVSDTAWACPNCSHSLKKEFEQSRDQLNSY